MSESRVDCPLCQLSADSESDVYRHLLVAHRKNALATALLDGERESSSESAAAAAAAPFGE